MRHNFIIGQYGGFNEAKYRRDFREGFYGIEACLFQNESDIERLHQQSKQDHFRIGVHFPLRASSSRTRDALFLAKDEAASRQAFARVQQELDYLATTIQPSYVLFHYPKPVLLDDRVDWGRWHFEDRSEYVFESEYPFELFQERSEALFEWLARKGQEYDFVPVLELDALNRYVTETGTLERLLTKYDTIKLCLDTARLYIQERMDPFFDAKAVIERYARYAEIIHLSTLRITESGERKQTRYPVLPDLDPSEDWAPIEDYMRIIGRHNPNVKIMFEHRSEQVSDEELSACYGWVEELLRATVT
ncbi:hypothetical protein [Paenibacillus sp. CF384]|uniref:hypothetical protein n=1 Tax=Paenibacillus sp. CF384 TaxID=1884382 RepID=UPI00089D1058|nr:hypothetical protein [Paenibacillus sp. CF384]SDX60729.1 hypothetical protein SAMN05518855_101732 [Paenibacillus sp. CF384]